MLDQKTLEVLEFPAVRRKVLEYCSFSGGREIIESLVPGDSFLYVKRELAYTRSALDCVYRYGGMPFYGIREIRQAVNLAKKGGVIGLNDLMNISSHNVGIRAVQGYIARFEKNMGAVNDLAESLRTVDDLASKIDRCVTADGKIADHASPELAKIRKEISRSKKELDQKAHAYIQSHTAGLTDSISAERNDRVVVLAKTAQKNVLGGIQYDESASGNTVYLEPNELIPYNNAVLAAKQKEAREVEKILRYLSSLVAKDAVTLNANMETLCILDALFAKAEYGKSLGGITPELCEDDVLDLKNAWHPLLDEHKAVRNHYRLADPHRALLITGPNTGGKTVSLKTIGLFALMTYAGIPVSADEAKVPFYRDIFVDIGDSQSIEQSLSTFSAHMAILAGIFEKADSNSLVLIDELISGTDPKEGEKLAIATLDFFRERGIFFIASTHYEQLKRYALEHDDVLIASMEFDLNRLEPTYKYREGTIGQSNAFDIAERYGFPKDLVDKAREMKKNDATETDRFMERLRKEEARNEALSEELEARLKENNELGETLRKEKERFEKERDKILEETREKYEEEYAERLEIADELIEELRTKNDYSLPETVRIKKELKDLSGEETAEEETGTDEFRTGDIVRILKNNQVGTITQIKGNRVILDVRGLTVKTTIDGLRKEKALPKENPRRKARKEFVPDTYPGEVNLIGMTVAEAMPVLDQFIDGAIVHRRSFVRVVHGFGTGKLRKAVWDYLKRNKAVKDYGPADANEGGAGATIVHFGS